MADRTNIAWCDATFNPWIGCTKVGPGCDHCYASVSTPARSLGVVWGAGQPRRRTSEKYWKQPLHWNARADSFRECGGCGWRGDLAFRAEPLALACPSCDRTDWKPARRRVFCASLADVFDNEVPHEWWRGDLWGLIASTPNLDWLLLTKRIGNAEKMLSQNRATGAVLPNIWLGATIVNQEEADRDIPKLLATPAAKRFVSYEPALGPVDFVSAVNQMCRHDGGYMEGETGAWICRECENQTEMDGLDWIIVGGESSQPGYPARPFDIQWARDTVRQCREAGVAVFVKQMGSALCVRNDSMEEWPDEDAFSDAIPEEYQPAYQGERVCIRLKDRAGAGPAEWPQDLRVREFPI